MLVCGRCGHHNAENTRFCASCDTYLDFSNDRKVDDAKAGEVADAPAPPAGSSGQQASSFGSTPAGSPGHGRQPARPDPFGADPATEDDYGTLLDDLAALGYSESERESAAAALAGETAPSWAPAEDEDRQQRHRGHPPGAGPEGYGQAARPSPSRAAQPGGVGAVLPQAVQPQAPRPGPTPQAEVEPEVEPEGGIRPVLPGERRHATVTRATTAEAAEQVSTAPRPGEVACPNCGRGNPPERRFCRCGHQFAPAVRAQPSRPATTSNQAPVSWWRRLLGQARDRQGGNLRTQYNRALELRTMIVRGMLLLGALGIGVSLIGPWSVRTWALDQFANITRRYQPVEVQETAFVGEDAEPEGFAAAFATDGQPGRAWAVGWDAERVVVDEPCAAAEGAASGALSVSFTQDTKVDRITVRAGLDRDNQQWSKQARPRTIDVRFSDGSCKRLDLKDEFGAQRFSVQAAAANGAIVTIVDAYPQLDGPGGLVALSEITFEARR